MIIKMIEVKVGMRVWSELLGEFFTVEEIAYDGGRVTLHEGIFALRGFPSTLLEVEG